MSPPDLPVPEKSSRFGLRAWGLGAGLALGLAVVAMGTAMEVSSRPKFCGSCHVMTPYYESWQESSHRNIACVDCHIPPGVTAELEKKYEAVAMVARYFTGTYSSNPWTEIDDASCLSCHERRLLMGRELFGDVLFDHSAHLAGMRRGKKLRCTSCHSQIVQGSHIAVTTDTCILCHFKDQTSGKGIARCTLCHQVPEQVVKKDGTVFEHKDVARFGMECTWCHSRPEDRDGAVPRERCLTCHNDPSRLERFDEEEELHQTHVTDHKVDCLNCHLEIQHVGPPKIDAAVTACATCHEQGHSPQMSLYSGVGGKGVEPMPDPMFLAGVRCEGCHLEIPGMKVQTHRASEVSCMSCHGPTYRKIYQAWERDLTSRSAALEKQIATTTARLRGPTPGAIHDARFNLDLVQRGRGVHNVRYALALLDQSYLDLNRARQEIGLNPLARPWKELPFQSACSSCHAGLPEAGGKIFGRSFDHEPHVISAGLECATCHRPHKEREKGEIVRFGVSGCDSCHHQDAEKQCRDCHRETVAETVPTDLGDFSHELHVEGMGQECVDCHQRSEEGQISVDREVCAGCHG